jgi:starch phosphorylase
MRSAISVNGSFFNTHRMLDQYVNNAYFPPEHPAGASAIPRDATGSAE